MKLNTFTQYLLIPLAAVALFGAGCGSTTTGPTGPDGGVWKSTDKGTAWVNKRALVQGAKITAGAASFNIIDLVMDPQDRNTLYAATGDSGLAYSLDGGDSWQLYKIANITKVNAVAVNPKDKCVIFVASANKIYRTDNCGRDWKEVYFEPRSDVSFTHLALDWFNPTVIYAGTSDGDILRSQDGGSYYEKIKRIDGVPITSIVVDPHDSRSIYFGTRTDGIWKTADGGMTWTQIKKQFGDDLADGRRVIQLVLDPVEANVIYDVCKYGILKSTDGGEKWEALNLTSPPGTVQINALAIDPKNNKNLIYTGVRTLQFSSDGGTSWAPKKLPTTQVGSVLLIDPQDSGVIYLGTTPPPQSN